MLLVKSVLFFASSALAAQQHFAPIDQAPLILASSDDGVANRYIVALKKEVGSDKIKFQAHLNFVQSYAKIANSLKSVQINSVDHIYDSAMFGYSATFDENTLDFLRYSEDIEYIEQDKLTELYSIQTGSTWGLQRISQRGLAVTPYTYTYNPSGGNGVTVYVLDTGININHVEFEGRASFGTVTVPNNNGTDCVGHGTHVAGIIGSKTYGVAKKVSLISVKVYGCDGLGYASYTIAGINWAINDHLAKTNEAIRSNQQVPKSIINSSSGASQSPALSNSIQAVVDNGLFFVNAAGSQNDDSCKFSPSSSPYAFTVGSIDQTDTRVATSSYGACINMFSPGTSIKSTYIGSNTAIASMSGTSVASAFAAGVFAVAQSTSGDYPYDFTTLKAIVSQNATFGTVTNAKGGTNSIVYSIPFM